MPNSSWIFSCLCCSSKKTPEQDYKPVVTTQKLPEQEEAKRKLFLELVLALYDSPDHAELSEKFSAYTKIPGKINPFFAYAELYELMAMEKNTVFGLAYKANLAFKPLHQNQCGMALETHGVRFRVDDIIEDIQETLKHVNQGERKTSEHDSEHLFAKVEAELKRMSFF